jgi:hypothetical protein
MIANSLRKASHPVYSPDLALSDFWIFGSMKVKLYRMEFDEPQQLLSAILEILPGLAVDTLNQVFEERM